MLLPLYLYSAGIKSYLISPPHNLLLSPLRLLCLVNLGCQKATTQSAACFISDNCGLVTAAKIPAFKNIKCNLLSVSWTCGVNLNTWGLCCRFGSKRLLLHCLYISSTLVSVIRFCGDTCELFPPVLTDIIFLLRWFEQGRHSASSGITSR